MNHFIHFLLLVVLFLIFILFSSGKHHFRKLYQNNFLVLRNMTGCILQFSFIFFIWFKSFFIEECTKHVSWRDTVATRTCWSMFKSIAGNLDKYLFLLFIFLFCKTNCCYRLKNSNLYHLQGNINAFFHYVIVNIIIIFLKITLVVIRFLSFKKAEVPVLLLLLINKKVVGFSLGR